MNKKTNKNMPKEVWVCASCLTASCWAGIFYCQEYRTANIVKMPVSALRKLKREHPSYWLREEVQV